MREMNTNKILTLVFILFAFGCKNNQESEFTCNYYGLFSSSKTMESITSENYNFSSNLAAIKVIDRIVSNAGLARNFEIFESSEIDNAAAIVYDEKRYVLYNNDFMELANEITNNSWTSISTLAHEIAHNLQCHKLSKNGNRPSIELEADKFSGFVLTKMGASLQEAQSAVLNLILEQESTTHPKRSERFKAIATGFKDGAENTKKKLEETNNSVNEVLQPITQITTETKSRNLISLGKHSFTMHWISWDYPGSVTISKRNENSYYVKGQQLSRENTDYIKIDGILSPVSEKELIFNGTIRYLYSHNNNGKECVKSGRQTFKATGARKYWRLQNNRNCEEGMLTDYIDIYFN